MSESAALLQSLRRIAGGVATLAPGSDDAGAWRHDGLARARLHELCADAAGGSADGAGVGAGAGMALALTAAAGAWPLLWLRTEAAERRAGRPSGAGVAELGLDPAALLVGVAPDEAALLRAAADAGRCAGLGTLLVEAWGPAPGLDLTASRRLMLAAEASGVTVVVLRLAARSRASASLAPSAAATRLAVAALPSAAAAGDAPGLPAPGAPAFLVECLRRRGGPAGQRWRVEWDRESKSFRPAGLDAAHDATLDAIIAERRPSPLPGAGVPMAAGRAAALDPPAPVRRAG